MRISEAESIVMEAFWRREGTLSAEDIVAATAQAQGWQEATVKTLLNRLLKKRAITAERDGRRYLYRALLKRADYVHVESKSLLDRLYGLRQFGPRVFDLHPYPGGRARRVVVGPRLTHAPCRVVHAAVSLSVSIVCLGASEMR